MIKMKIYPEIKTLHFFGEGEFSCEYLIEFMAKVHSLPEWDGTFNTFVDFENATISYLSEGFEEYQEYFGLLQQSGVPRKWSIYTKQVITRQNASMGLLMQSKAIKVDLFQHRDMALEFLEIPKEKWGLLNPNMI